jgi:ATP-dependent DNA helicase RecQ
VRAYVARLRRLAERDAHNASADARGAPRAHLRRQAQIGPAEIDDGERLLLSIAERAGAVVLEPGPGGGLIVELTGRGSPRAAYAAIKAAKDRGWESYRAIERFISNGSLCRRRQILDHFGDDEPCAPLGRCCDVCQPDDTLRGPASAASSIGARPLRVRKPHARASAGDSRARSGEEPRARRLQAPVASRDGLDGRADPPPEPGDPVRFQRLKAWRLERSEGKPAYTVASNAALEGIVRAQPSSLEELIAVRGIGPTFCERHGESLLKALRELAPEAGQT